ncbi:hypothetical protein BDQ17DRAFT_1335940 [Cyathus striatus]|nr:hypothetical protein BDQ17DRAFT_1335940 [Cyathus striatus]
MRGVSNRRFPYGFYPIVYPVGPGPSYLYRDGEYGKVDNTTRPGGILRQLSLAGKVNNTFKITSDNVTIFSLYTDLSNCTSTYELTMSTPITLNSTSYDHPKPEEAGDSVVMYSMLPSGINASAVGCVNRTVDEMVFLSSAAEGSGVNSVFVLWGVVLLWPHDDVTVV